MNAVRFFSVVGALVGALLATAASAADQPGMSAQQGVQTPAASVAKGGLTRAQVQAELAEARRLGLLSANPTQYPSEYIEHARRQSEALAQQDIDVHQKALID